MPLVAGESFATRAEALAYATAREWTDWIAASDNTQDAKLREATDYIAAAWTWPGYLADSEQVLPFPRTGYYDREGRAITGTPEKLKAATIEAARLALNGALMGGEVTATVKREKVGPIETEYAERSSSSVRSERLSYIGLLLISTGARGGVGAVNVRLSKS